MDERQSAFSGSVTFCPSCYPQVDMFGPSFHDGDLVADDMFGRDIDVYSPDSVKITNLFRVVLRPNSDPVVMEAVEDDQGKFIRCINCGNFLRRIRSFPGLRVHFPSDYPRYRIPWFMEDGVYIDTVSSKGETRHWKVKPPNHLP